MDFTRNPNPFAPMEDVSNLNYPSQPTGSFYSEATDTASVFDNYVPPGPSGWAEAPTLFSQPYSETPDFPVLEDSNGQWPLQYNDGPSSWPGAPTQPSFMAQPPYPMTPQPIAIAQQSIPMAQSPFSTAQQPMSFLSQPVHMARQHSGTTSIHTGSHSHRASMMRRSSSATSDSSVRSETGRQRSLRTLAESNDRGRNTPLAPRARPSSLPSSSQPSRIGPVFDLASRVTKSKSRRRSERTPCPYCQSTVSGDHELARHIRLHHVEKGMRWEIIDPADKGLAPLLPIEKPIKDCKKCAEHKLYGQNYNAAAHLRRCHFNTAGAGTGSGGDSPGGRSKLGGNSGGDEPDICYLEYFYMKMVFVRRRTAEDEPSDDKWIRTGDERETKYRVPAKDKDKKGGDTCSQSARSESGGFVDFASHGEPGEVFQYSPEQLGGRNSATARGFSEIDVQGYGSWTGDMGFPVAEGFLSVEQSELDFAVSPQESYDGL